MNREVVVNAAGGRARRWGLARATVCGPAVALHSSRAAEGPRNTRPGKGLLPASALYACDRRPAAVPLTLMGLRFPLVFQPRKGRGTLLFEAAAPSRALGAGREAWSLPSGPSAGPLVPNC